MGGMAIDYLTCTNCDSPCYVFELDAKGTILNAFCQLCGNDEASGFRLPDDEEMEPED
jgi:hypothetical protein